MIFGRPNCYLAAGRRGIALAAVSDKGERLGTVAARVEGTVASIRARWVTGEPDVLEALVADLTARLQEGFRVGELRACRPAPG